MKIRPRILRRITPAEWRGNMANVISEPMSHVFPVENVMREDVVTNGDGSEATLANAPERKEDAFVVPKTVD